MRVEHFPNSKLNERIRLSQYVYKYVIQLRQRLSSLSLITKNNEYKLIKAEVVLFLFFVCYPLRDCKLNYEIHCKFTCDMKFFTGKEMNKYRCHTIF